MRKLRVIGVWLASLVLVVVVSYGGQHQITNFWAYAVIMFIYWGLMLTIPAVLIMFGAGRLEDRIIEEGFLPLAIPVGLAIGGIVPFVVWMIFGFDGQVSDAYDALAKYTLGSGVMWSASFFFRVPPMPKADPY